MTECVLTESRALEKYSDVAGEERIEELRGLAKPLSGARVLHINATAAGGGVAEILKTLVPLMCDLGLETEWRVMRGADEFYQVTKSMHNGLQGKPARMKPEMKEIWLKYNALNADILNCNGTYDFVVVHDPQPAGILRLLRERNGHRNLGSWIWRCHIDLTSPQSSFLSFIKPYIEAYDAAIFTRREFSPKDLHGPRCFEAAPGIDPLSAKNRLLDEGEVRSVLLQCGIDPERPFIFKLSRFDPWKDFAGIIDIYDRLKKDFPELQLVLAGGGAGDDPEAWTCYKSTVKHAQGKEDIHILWGKNGVTSPALNAFHQAARVVVQKSIREGFGLVVSEALWKGCPVVASDIGGIALQIAHRESGYLARSADDWVGAISHLLRHRDDAARVGNAGKRMVRENFLITRYLRDYLQIFSTLRN